jgi:hypothetical protein
MRLLRVLDAADDGAKGGGEKQLENEGRSSGYICLFHRHGPLAHCCPPSASRSIVPARVLARLLDAS